MFLSEFQEKVLTILEDLKIQLKDLRRDVQNLKRAPVPNSEVSQEEVIVESFFFPIRNNEEMAKMENMAKDASSKVKMVSCKYSFLVIE